MDWRARLQAILDQPTIHDVLAFEIYGVSLATIATGFAIVLVTLALRRAIAGVIERWVHKLAERSASTWDDTFVAAVRPPLEGAILLYGLWMATRVMVLPLESSDLVETVDGARGVGMLLLAAWAVFRGVNMVDDTLRRRATDPDLNFDLSLVPLVTTSLRILVVLVFGTMIAHNLGYSVGGLVASLGLGGAAVALASRDAVANLFGFVMILVDKPFKVGDWIRGGDFEGVVEEVGLRSTRIRTFEKTIESIPNNLLANVWVENMDRRKDFGLNVRRINQTIGVTYSTTPAQIRDALDGIRRILREDEGVDQRMTQLVRFTDFADSSLSIFVYYFADKADWDYYLAVRERVNLAIMELFAELGIDFAFPSRSVYLQSLPADLFGGKDDGIKPGTLGFLGGERG
jgi:MscS family membrane protein